MPLLLRSSLVLLLICALGCAGPSSSQRSGFVGALFSGGTIDGDPVTETAQEDEAAEAPQVLFPVPSDGQLPPTTPAEWIGRTAPDFQLPDSKGKLHRLSDQEHEIVVLEWSSLVCSFVSRHYARLNVQSISKSYQAKGVSWLAIDSSLYPIAHPIKIDQWIEKRRIPHPILLDPDGVVGEAFGVRTTPTIVILQKGEVVYFGPIDDDIWGRNSDRRTYVVETLDLLLAGKPVADPTPSIYGTDIRYLSVETQRREAREKAREAAKRAREKGDAPKPPKGSGGSG